MHVLLRLLLPLLALMAIPAGNASATAYTIAIVPQFTPLDIGLRWTPLLDRLKQETGVALQIRAHDSIPNFEAEFLRGIPDFVLLNPYHMVMAAKAQGYRPLLRSSQPLSGVLVVDGRGGINALGDLKGAAIAFPAPNAFGASLYMRALLTEKEKLAFTPAFVGTHQNVYRSVVYGDAQAGGGAVTTLAKEPAGVQGRLKVLYRTPGTASHPLAVHPRVPDEVVDKVVRALLHMASDPDGRKLLDQVDLKDVVTADYARDYAPLELLKLERYVVVKNQ